MSALANDIALLFLESNTDILTIQINSDFGEVNDTFINFTQTNYININHKLFNFTHHIIMYYITTFIVMNNVTGT